MHKQRGRAGHQPPSGCPIILRSRAPPNGRRRRRARRNCRRRKQDAASCTAGDSGDRLRVVCRG